MVYCKYPNQGKSIYQQEFIERPIERGDNSYNANKLPRVNPKHPMDGISTYKVMSVSHMNIANLQWISNREATNTRW